MSDSLSIDAREMTEFAADLGRISAKSLPAVDKIVEKAAIGIKKDLRGQAIFSPHFKTMAEAMSYDSSYRVGQVAYEIGPDKARGGRAGRAAELANVFFFGGANGGGGKGDLDGALKTEEPYMMKALDEYLTGLL